LAVKYDKSSNSNTDYTTKVSEFHQNLNPFTAEDELTLRNTCLWIQK